VRILFSKIGEGNPLQKWYRHLSSDPEIVKLSTIPVGRMQGSVLFITGQDRGDVPNFADIGVDRQISVQEALQKTKNRREIGQKFYYISSLGTS
jgi:hypothetical protein